MSLSWLSNGFKLPKPQQDPRQCHLPGSPTSSRREQHCACSKCTVSPSPVLPPPLPRSLFVFNASLLVREKQKIPQNSFLYPLSRKMGQFTAANVRRISCLGVWKVPRVESSSQPARPLLSLAQTTTKTATTAATTTTKHATWARAHTNTPTEPNQTDAASRRSFWAAHSGGRHIPWPGAKAAPLPAPHHLSAAFCLL